MIESLNINKSIKIPGTSFNEQDINKEKEINPENEFKNPYLKKDDVPKIEIINKNKMIYDGIEYNINEYLNEINKVHIDIFDTSIYNYCKKCRKKINRHFCKKCNKNLCEKCYEELNCIDNGPTWDLDDIKDSYIDNINEIKNILNNNIIYIKEEDEVIKRINNYININIINNDKFIDDINLIGADFSLNKDIEYNDILLIYQIISEDYINYFHYKNIENILNYLRDNYNSEDNNKYNGYGKIIYENGEYYIGEFKDGLKYGKGILYYKNGKIMFLGDFIDDKFEGAGYFSYQIYDYYIGERKDNIKNGKGILYYILKMELNIKVILLIIELMDMEQ